jgi:hypothetical protein
LIGKNTVDSNSYFTFTNSPNAIPWYDEFDYIDLGNAIGSYKVSTYGGINIYWREFEKGYIYVNPTAYNVAGIALPQTCKQLTHDNLRTPVSEVAKTAAINLAAHRGTILAKYVS